MTGDLIIIIIGVLLVLASLSMIVRNTVAALFSFFHQAESAVQTVALLTPVQTA